MSTIEPRWLTPADVDFYGFHGRYHNGQKAIKYYNDKLTVRQSLYKVEKTDFGEKHSEELNNKGYVTIPEFFSEKDKETLLKIKNHMNHLVNTGTNLKRKNNSMAMINQPLLNIPDLHKILFNERIIEILTSFFGCVPALSSVAARKSFVSSIPPDSNQVFHRDFNSLTKHVKIAFYLHDVSLEGGPFTYVEESNKKMPMGWWKGHYYPNEYIENMYGKDRVKFLTSNFGDLMIANTRGFHKGVKPISEERLAVHACYMIHPELGGEGHQKETPPEGWFKIRKEDHQKLSTKQKPVADFLQIIEK